MRNAHSVAGIFVARHDCGKIVRACVSEPAWPENDERISEFLYDAGVSGYPAELLSRRPELEDWCGCFRGSA